MNLSMRIVCGLLVVALGASAGCSRGKTKAKTEPVAQADPKADAKAAPKADPKPAPPVAKKADAPKGAEAKGEPAKDEPKAVPAPPKRPQSGTIVRRFEAGKMQQMLREIHTAALNFETERNRYPANVQELAPYYQNNATINQAFKDGDIEFVWRAVRPEEPGKTVLAYETQPGRMNDRVVLFADGMAQVIAEETFLSLPKAPTRK